MGAMIDSASYPGGMTFFNSAVKAGTANYSKAFISYSLLHELMQFLIVFIADCLISLELRKEKY